MITTDTTNKLGTTVTKDLRTVMQDYDFNLSKLERVMFGAGNVAALGHELERRGLKRTIVVTGKTLGGSALHFFDPLSSRSSEDFRSFRR